MKTIVITIFLVMIACCGFFAFINVGRSFREESPYYMRQAIESILSMLAIGIFTVVINVLWIDIIDEKYVTVPVKIVDTRTEESNSTAIIPIGDIFIPFASQHTTYKIIFENTDTDTRYECIDRSLYDEYKNCIGNSYTGILKQTVYKDNRIEEEIIDIEN